MSRYRNVILAALAAVISAYLWVCLSLVGGPLPGAQGPLRLVWIVGAYLAWIMGVVGVTASVTRGQGLPDEREAGIDLRSEQVGARVLEAGVFVVLALVLIAAAIGEAALGVWAPSRPDAMVFYLLSALTFATLARLLYALWHEAHP